MSILNTVPAPKGYSNVSLQEIDVSQTLSPLSALNYGALYASTNGPVNELVIVTDEDSVVNYLGEPTNDNYDEFFSIARVSKYKVGVLGGTGFIARVVGTGTMNGALAVTSTGLVNDTDLTTQRIDNDEQAISATVVFDTDTVANGGDDTVAKLKFFSKYPTAVVYKIALANATDFATANIYTGVSFATEFMSVGTPTGTEVAIAILDVDGNILNKYICDTVRGNVDGFGESNYIENVLENDVYVRVYDNEALIAIPFSFEATSLTKGAFVLPETGDYVDALELYEDVDSVDVNYVVGNPNVISESITLCESRQDCSMRWSASPALIVGKDINTAVTDLVTYSTVTQNRNTTFASFYGNIALINDKYSNKVRWISLSGDLVGLRIQKNLSNNAWTSSDGPNYGQIKDIIKLGINPKPEYQRILQLNKINPIINKAGVGKITMGEQNFTSVKSALQDSPIRELNIYIWRASRMFLFFKLFEQNDDITRNLVSAQMRNLLGSIEAGRGIEAGWVVRCDGTNNTPDVVNQNRLIISLAYTPIKSIHEIVQQLIVTASGVDIETIL